MGKETNQMNKVIRCIALLESFRKVKLLLIMLMIGEFFIRFFHRYAITTLVILLWLVAGGFIIEQIIEKDHTKEYAKLFPVLCKRYHYKDKELKANFIVLLFWWVFMLALLYANMQSSIEEAYIIYAPIVYMVVALLAIIGLYIDTKSSIKRLLMNNLL